MMHSMLDRWWLLTIRGVAAILFGVITFVAPLASIFALVILFGAYSIVDGVAHLMVSVRSARSKEPWGWYAFAGIAGIIAGIVALAWPGIGALALLFVIAAWAVATGVAMIFAAIRLREQIRGEWLLATSGALSIVLGVLLLLFPGPGALAVVMWIGAWAVIFGGVVVALSLRLRSLRQAPERRVPVTPAPTPTAA
jgi:uncharacterized membrane protein HdeD (DUF308 family)